MLESLKQKVVFGVIAGVITIMLAMGFAVKYLYGQTVTLEKSNAELTESVRDKSQQITDMMSLQIDVGELDAKHYKEMTDAQSKIDELNLCISSGKCKRLRINATCKVSANNTTGAAGVVDAEAPELDGAARENYFILRQRIILATKQIDGLQDYIGVLRKSCSDVDNQHASK